MADAGVSSVVIGEVTRQGLRVINLDGVENDLAVKGQGWDHFAS